MEAKPQRTSSRCMVACPPLVPAYRMGSQLSESRDRSSKPKGSSWTVSCSARALPSTKKGWSNW
eukprot:8561727-Alexandrium_andersonii.AAC.1